MGTRTTMPRARVVALAAWLASGCGTTVSLDENPPATTTGASSTGESSTGASTSTSTSDPDGTSGDVSLPDVPLPDLPPPFMACPSGCSVELPLVWAWDAPAAPPGEDDGGSPDPPDPDDRPLAPGLVAMVRMLDGSFAVAERRDGASWLTQVNADGSFAWTLSFEPECDCELVDVALAPSGELFALGQSKFADDTTWLQLMSVLPFPNEAFVLWTSWEPLWGTPTRPGRVGSVLALPDGSAVVLAVETGLDGDVVIPKDWFEVRYYVGGVQESQWLLDTQLAVDEPRRPRGVALTKGSFAAALLGSAGTGDYVLWMTPWSSVVGDVEPLAWPIDAMAVGLDGAVVAAGLERPAKGVPVLHAAALPYEQPPAWHHAIDLPASTTGAPALAVDGSGRTYLAVRTGAEGSDEPAVMLARLEPDGTPAWSTVLPLPADDVPIPLALSLAGDDLVLAALVDGRLHLERREQGCRCD